MLILAIDPGTSESGLVIFDTDAQRLVKHGKFSNESILQSVRALNLVRYDRVVCEDFTLYAKRPMGAECVKAIRFSGQLAEAILTAAGQYVIFQPRQLVCRWLCSAPSAPDSAIRQAIIDRFGGKEKGIGRSAFRGPLYGMRADSWLALGHALTYWLQNSKEAMQ